MCLSFKKILQLSLKLAKTFFVSLTRSPRDRGTTIVMSLFLISRSREYLGTIIDVPTFLNCIEVPPNWVSTSISTIVKEQGRLAWQFCILQIPVWHIIICPFMFIMLMATPIHITHQFLGRCSSGRCWCVRELHHDVECRRHNMPLSNSHTHPSSSPVPPVVLRRVWSWYCTSIQCILYTWSRRRHPSSRVWSPDSSSVYLIPGRLPELLMYPSMIAW